MAVTVSTIIKTTHGALRVCFHETEHGECVSFSYGDVATGTPIVRLHSSCLFGEAFHSLQCDCGPQIDTTLERMVAEGAGVLVYAYQEGRGVGLKTKIAEMEIQRTLGYDTIDALKHLGYDDYDFRKFEAQVHALHDLNVSKTVKFHSGNVSKVKAITDGGYSVTEFVKIDPTTLDESARRELDVKKKKMGYTY